MITAIARYDDVSVYARLDEFGCDGHFKRDGSVIRGTLGTLPQDELAFRIWAQTQPPQYKEKQLREMWAKR